MTIPFSVILGTQIPYITNTFLINYMVTLVHNKILRPVAHSASTRYRLTEIALRASKFISIVVIQSTRFRQSEQPTDFMSLVTLGILNNIITFILTKIRQISHNMIDRLNHWIKADSSMDKITPHTSPLPFAAVLQKNKQKTEPALLASPMNGGNLITKSISRILDGALWLMDPEVVEYCP